MRPTILALFLISATPTSSQAAAPRDRVERAFDQLYEHASASLKIAETQAAAVNKAKIALYGVKRTDLAAVRTALSGVRAFTKDPNLAYDGPQHWCRVFVAVDNAGQQANNSKIAALTQQINISSRLGMYAASKRDLALAAIRGESLSEATVEQSNLSLIDMDQKLAMDGTQDPGMAFDESMTATEC